MGTVTRTFRIIVEVQHEDDLFDEDLPVTVIYQAVVNKGTHTVLTEVGPRDIAITTTLFKEDPTINHTLQGEPS